MQWKDAYSVGIQEIDDHHKHLLKLFSQIERSVKLRCGWKEVIYDLVDLKVFARRHFEFEEGLMRMYGYPQLKEHEGSHQLFFTKLGEIESKSIPEIAQSELIKFLCDWLKTHISGEDKGYAEHALSGAAIVRPSAATLKLVESAA